MLFLFNLGGYYLVFWGIMYQTDKETWSRLEAEQYDQKESLTIKIPLALPYSLNEGVYENINGNFEQDGKFYKGIKQKLERDTLFILCIEDSEKAHLANTLADYQRVSSDLPSQSKQGQQLLSKVLNEYESFRQIEIIHYTGWEEIIPYSHSSLQLISSVRSVQYLPPKTLS